MGIGAAVSQAPPAGDFANAVVSGSFVATGQSHSFLVDGPFNACLYGSSGPNGSWTATIRLERSFDGGTTWIVCGIGGSGTQAVYSTPNQDVSLVVAEPERGVLYRWNCTAYTSGTINYRFSASGAAALSLGLASNI